MKQGLVRSSLFALAIGAGGLAEANVLFTDFGPGSSYLTDQGYSVTGRDSTPGQFEQAFQFSPVTSGTLTQIDIAICNLVGPHSAEIALYNDSLNALGSLIQTWSITVAGQFGDNNPPVQILDSTGITLTQGARYWLYAGASGTAQQVWNTNDQAVSGLGITNHNGVGWQPTTEPIGAFDIQGAPVPEPAPLAALAFGLIAATRRRRSK